MKNICIIAVMAILFMGCRKVEVAPIPQTISPELTIASTVGIKLQTVFVTSEVAMNIKSDMAQTVTVRIFDIANKVVSRETVNVKAGDNIVKVYTNALPSSAYRIGLFDAKGNQLGITDFNKL